MTLRELFGLEYSVQYQGNRCVRVSRCMPNGSMCPTGWVWFEIWIMAIGVEDGVRGRIVSGGLQEILDLERTSVDSMVIHIRDMLQQIQMHEVNETITFDGARVFDPHTLVHRYDVISDSDVCPSAELTSGPELEIKEAA